MVQDALLQAVRAMEAALEGESAAAEAGERAVRELQAERTALRSKYDELQAEVQRIARFEASARTWRRGALPPLLMLQLLPLSRSNARCCGDT